MKFLKKVCLLFVLILVPLWMNSCDDDVPTTQVETTPNLLNIEVVGANNERVVQWDTYRRSDDIKVYAYFSDGKVEDVTSNAKFSFLSTEEEGSHNVSVSYTYKDVEYETEYTVTVVKYEVKNLILNTTNCKLVYEQNDRLDISGLKVRALYTNDEGISISKYDVLITDAYNNPYQVDDPLVYEGIYDVKITYKEASASYQIAVCKECKVNYGYSPKDSLDYEPNKEEDFKSEKVLFKSPYANISAIGDNIRYDYQKATFGNQTFDSALCIGASSSSNEMRESDFVRITVLDSATVVLFVDQKNNALSIRDNDKNVIEYVGNKNSAGFIYCKLTAGVYTLSANESDVKLYNVDFGFVDKNSVDSYEKISVNLNDLKQEYSYMEELDITPLKVYGVEGEKEEEIEKSNYKVELTYDSKVVKEFKLGGTYKVKVSYYGDVLCYNRVCEYDVKYVLSDVEKLYLTTLKIDNVDLKLENGVFSYNIVKNTEATQVRLYLEYLDNPTVLINGQKYEDYMYVTLEGNETNIRIDIKTETMTVSYLIIVRK